MGNLLVEKLKKIKYVCSDIDGTIVDGKHEVTPKTIQVVQQLIKRGYKFGLVSGRPPYLADYETKTLSPNMPYVGCNGSWIFNFVNQTTERLCAIDGDFIKLLLPKVVTMGLSFLLCAKDCIYYYHGLNEFSKNNLQARLPMLSRAAVPLRPIEKLSDEFLNQPFVNLTVYLIDSKFVIPNEFVEISQSYEVQMIKGSEDCFDVCNSTNNKGSGIKCVLEETSLTTDEVLVIGDSYNDIPMFKIAGVAVALNQAPDDVKKFATIITKFDNNHDGFAHFMEEYFLSN